QTPFGLARHWIDVQLAQMSLHAREARILEQIFELLRVLTQAAGCALVVKRDRSAELVTDEQQFCFAIALNVGMPDLRDAHERRAHQCDQEKDADVCKTATPGGDDASLTDYAMIARAAHAARSYYHSP